MLLILLACHPAKKACDDYVDAVSACYEAAGEPEGAEGLVAAADCDVGLVAYEMAVLVDRVGPVLTPALRDELRRGLPR